MTSLKRRKLTGNSLGESSMSSSRVGRLRFSRVVVKDRDTKIRSRCPLEICISHASSSQSAFHQSLLLLSGISPYAYPSKCSIGFSAVLIFLLSVYHTALHIHFRSSSVPNILETNLHLFTLKFFYFFSNFFPVASTVRIGC